MATVLVVEDDWDFQQLERIALEFGGFKVLTAANGVEALSVLTRHQPCVIVLDLMMPVLDGLAFLDQQKRASDPRVRDVPVICVSAAGPDFSREALRRGALDCMAKPADLDELCAAVEAVCSRQSPGQ